MLCVCDLLSRHANTNSVSREQAKGREDPEEHY